MHQNGTANSNIFDGLFFEVLKGPVSFSLGLFQIWKSRKRITLIIKVNGRTEK
jgi:hypothetical protein